MHNREERLRSPRTRDEPSPTLIRPDLGGRAAEAM